MMSRIRRTRSFWRLTSRMSSRTGSSRGRPEIDASTVAIGLGELPPGAAPPPPPGSGSRYSSRRSTSDSAARRLIAAIA